MGCCGSSERPNSTEKEKIEDDVVSNGFKQNNLSVKNKNKVEPLQKENQSDPVSDNSTLEFSKEDIINLDGHSQYVDICKWNPKKPILMTASSDQTCYLWDCQDVSKYFQESLSSKDGNHNKKSRPSVARSSLQHSSVNDSYSVTCADWSSDGKMLAIGNDQGSVYIWSSKGSYIDSWKPHEGMTNSVKINGHWVLSGGDLICVYSIAQKMAYMWGWCESLITDVEWMSRNGIDQYLVAQVSGNICLNVFTADQQLKQLGKVEDYDDYNIPDDSPSREFKSHTEGIYKICKHPDHGSCIFASCSVDTTINLWNIESPDAPLNTLKGHFGYVVDIAFNSKGDRLISSSFDGTVRIWNIKTGDCVFTLDEHRDRVNKISVSPKDENIFTTAGNDGVVHFWKMNSGQLILSHEGPGRMLNVSFDSNGDKLAATSYSSVNIIPLQYKK